MQSLTLETSELVITEDTYLIDTGDITTAVITLEPGVILHYTLLPDGPRTDIDRLIRISEKARFSGNGIFVDDTVARVVTEIIGDSGYAELSLLALVQDGMQVSLEGVARVDAPYRDVETRVDQTNILIGTGGRVRGVPRLEIATDDVRGGHSCKIHRLGGESLFYLQSRGLDQHHAESMLLNSEILKHLSSLPPDMREGRCGGIHQRLLRR